MSADYGIVSRQRRWGVFSEISIACKTIELISNSFSSTQQQRDTAAIASPALQTHPAHSWPLFLTEAQS